MGERLFGEDDYILTTERQRELQQAVGIAALELQNLQPQVVSVDPAQLELATSL